MADTLNLEAERAAWEAWAISARLAYRDDRHGLCFYNASSKPASWEAWQARAATKAAPADALSEFAGMLTASQKPLDSDIATILHKNIDKLYSDERAPAEDAREEVQDARRAIFNAYSECLADDNLTVDQIADKLLDAARRASSVPAIPGAVEVPKVVHEALDIALDLAVAEADNVHRTYAGYKQHRHEAVDRDVDTVKRAIDALNPAAPSHPSEAKAGEPDNV